MYQMIKITEAIKFLDSKDESLTSQSLRKFLASPSFIEYLTDLVEKTELE